MTYEESIEQLKSLIEHFNNGGNDFNATDIEAIKYLLKENKELKKQLEGVREEREYLYNKLNIQNKYLAEENSKLYKQQKGFIKYLEEPIKLIKQGNPINISEYTSAKLDTLKEILQKYKEIIGDDN